MTVTETLNQLEMCIEKSDIPCAERNWGGARVCIETRAPAKTKGGFYPGPRSNWHEQTGFFEKDNQLFIFAQEIKE